MSGTVDDGVEMSTQEKEHPYFAKIRALPEPWCSRFPRYAHEIAKWEPMYDRIALGRQVLVVAVTRVEGKWAAYIGAVPGTYHDTEWRAVRENGDKLQEVIARAIFPTWAPIPYAL